MYIKLHIAVKWANTDLRDGPQSPDGPSFGIAVAAAGNPRCIHKQV